MTKAMKVTYRDRRFIDKYRCVDRERQVVFCKTWWVGGLLYGYLDRFNTMTIAREDIIRIEEA